MILDHSRSLPGIGPEAPHPWGFGPIAVGVGDARRTISTHSLRVLIIAQVRLSVKVTHFRGEGNRRIGGEESSKGSTGRAVSNIASRACRAVTHK